ncbi:MAG TPA: hypothetical protein PKJ95_00385 [Atribacterota bacterium]|nr:hypothetical protein [Atribacterota bacterium]
MTQIDFDNFINFLKNNKIFPPSLLNDPVWQKNTQIFLSTFERFLKTDQGQDYIKDLPNHTYVRVIEDGSIIPASNNNCIECPQAEDLIPKENTIKVKKVNPFEQILRGEYKK